MAGYLANRLAAVISRRLPLAFCYWIGQRVADVHYLADPIGRHGVEANIRRILTHRGVVPAAGAVRGMARKTYQHFGKYVVDFYRYSTDFCREIESKVSLANQSYLDACLAAGRGAVLVTGHIGNWELGGLVLARMGRPVTAVFRPSGSRHVDEMWRDHRARRGIRLLPLGEAMPGLVRTLREGGLVSLLVDRDFTGHSRVCRFFGADVHMPIGAAVLSRKTRAPILPAFMLRQVDDRFLFKFFEPIDPVRAGSVEAAQSAVLRVLEDVIGNHVHQWFVFRDFWATVEPVVKGVRNARR